MLKKLLMLACLISMLVAGCGDSFRVSPVVEGMPAPHDGYNVGPGLYLSKGEPAKVTGTIIYIQGTEPEELIMQQKMKVFPEEE